LGKTHTVKKITTYLSACLLIFFLFLLSDATAQKNKEFTKDNFSDAAGLKEALKNIKEGDRYYNVSHHLHDTALVYFLRANNFNSDNAELNMKIGHCYLNTTQKHQALPYLEKAQQLDPNVDNDLHYLLAQAYHLDMQWDKAISGYTTYKGLLSAKDEKNIKKITKHIEECNNGKQLTEKPIKVLLKNLGENINSQHAEYAPIISADQGIMIYTSRRPSTTGGGIDYRINKYYEDTYIAYFNEKDSSFSSAQNLGAPVNTKGHESAIGLSNDGQKLFIYKDDKGNGNIYVSKLNGDKWSVPERLPEPINSIYHESTASFSPDTKTIFFVSDRAEGGLGGLDIWKSTWDETKKKWGPAINLGPEINTEYDEEGVFMHPDGKTLYFSSKGHNSMGGYDVFKATFNDATGKWTLKNRGYPVNTTDDDVFFVMAANGKHAYFSSIRKEGFGEKDIYRITFLEEDKPDIILVKGKVTNKVGQALFSQIEVVNKKTGQIVNIVESNSATGEYLVSLPLKEGGFTITYKSDGYISQTVDIADKEEYTEVIQNIVLDKDARYAHGTVTDEDGKPIPGAIVEVRDKDGNVLRSFTADKNGKYKAEFDSKGDVVLAFKAPGFIPESIEIKDGEEYDPLKNASLKRLKKDVVVNLKNIFYDFGKATLRDESITELSRVLSMLKETPSLKIEISGHTDNIGSDQSNQKLSQARAQSVVDYLTSKGVAKSRLVAKGYGESKPVATNETEEGRQINRRTEFKILEFDEKAVQVQVISNAGQIISDEAKNDTPVIAQNKTASASGNMPQKFVVVDANNDGKISSEETIKAIDAFFDGSIPLKAPDILELIDYFFEQ
jgi:outer membrane protein OmpA-like peptidoglycan-associated protein/tetratricopeptide (TPR) repeat protein